MKASAKGGSGDHPVILSLRPASAEAADLPALNEPAPEHKSVRLKVPASDWEHLVLLAVVQRPDAVLVIQCDCAWERRTLWETDFNQILNTFELR